MVAFTVHGGTWGCRLLLSADAAVATPGFRKPASPNYSSSDVCPERCSVSGPSTGNWSVYPDFKQSRKCKETMFYDFSLYDDVDNKSDNHRIHACSSFGPDFSNMPAFAVRIASTESVDVEFEIGWWNEGFGLAGSATERPFIIYRQSDQATIGLYIGQGLLNQGISQPALKLFHDNLENLSLSTPTLSMQLCGPHYDSAHIFGIMATSDGMFAPIQDAIKSWANATCPLLLLIDLLTLGSLGTLGPFFNTSLKKHAWFIKKGSTTIAKDVLPGGKEPKWTPEAQDEFSAYMGQVIFGWANITSLAAESLFDGSDESINTI
ncbi:hypothetical protein BDW59DRAFT_159112 [Aspergillus cavernicola]|uniref:Alpha/Beta hydrolase protein n=1 Tax=Aspergillus cavernicola TaxID=176166 RepID=A0ABR4IPC6_9EURO